MPGGRGQATRQALCLPALPTPARFSRSQGKELRGRADAGSLFLVLPHQTQFSPSSLHSIEHVASYVTGLNVTAGHEKVLEV